MPRPPLILGDAAFTTASGDEGGRGRIIQAVVTADRSMTRFFRVDGGAGKAGYPAGSAEHCASNNTASALWEEREAFFPTGRPLFAEWSGRAFKPNRFPGYPLSKKLRLSRSPRGATRNAGERWPCVLRNVVPSSILLDRRARPIALQAMSPSLGTARFERPTSTSASRALGSPIKNSRFRGAAKPAPETGGQKGKTSRR